VFHKRESEIHKSKLRFFDSTKAFYRIPPHNFTYKKLLVKQRNPSDCGVFYAAFQGDALSVAPCPSVRPSVRVVPSIFSK